MSGIESGAVAAGIKWGGAAGIAIAVTVVVSVLAVVVGWRFAPLDHKHPTKDAGNRLAAGLLCSFTMGPAIASVVIDRVPSLMVPWLKIFPDNALAAHLGAAAPFLALTGVAGFWIVAIVVRTLRGTEGKTITDYLPTRKG